MLGVSSAYFSPDSNRKCIPCVYVDFLWANQETQSFSLIKFRLSRTCTCKVCRKHFVCWRRTLVFPLALRLSLPRMSAPASITTIAPDITTGLAS